MLFNLKYIIALVIVAAVAAFHSKRFSKYSKPLKAVDEWLTKGTDANEIPRNIITVRFINNLSGKDISIEVEEGSNLLAMGDMAGVKLPRACRTGLCGSCTCEVQDPQAIATATNPRDGFATIRACSAKCYVPPGMQEMVIDVYRMKSRADAIAAKKSGVPMTGSSGVSTDYVRKSY